MIFFFSWSKLWSLLQFWDVSACCLLMDSQVRSIKTQDLFIFVLFLPHLSCSVSEYESPTIIGPLHNQIKADPGNSFVVYPFVCTLTLTSNRICCCLFCSQMYIQKQHVNPSLLTFAGKQLVLHCDALPNCEVDEALIYWLVDGSFPEDSPSHDRIIETNE